MPGLLAERDAEIDAMSEEEWEAAGLWLLAERPDLDVDLVFRLRHPFPPLCRVAERLAVEYAFQWSEVRAIAPDPNGHGGGSRAGCRPFPRGLLVSLSTGDANSGWSALTVRRQSSRVSPMSDRATHCMTERPRTAGMLSSQADCRTCPPDRGRRPRMWLARPCAYTTP